MCDIWKDNKNLKQLIEKDISGLMDSIKRLRTQKLVMSGGEALLNPNFFKLCEIIREQDIKISLLSTGLLLKKHAEQISRYIHDVIVSLDGDETVHDQIRNTTGAFQKLKEGVSHLKQLNPAIRITARTVIQRENFMVWNKIIDAAREMQLDQVSFLPADVSSHAFNRQVLWSDQRVSEVLPSIEQLPGLKDKIEFLIRQYSVFFQNGFIAENPGKLRNIYQYYAACHGLDDFPFKKCNAPWVSAVIEPDGNLRPCFFHEAVGNIREQPLDTLLNSGKALGFRKSLNMETNSTCRKCVCYLNLPPGAKF